MGWALYGEYLNLIINQQRLLHTCTTQLSLITLITGKLIVQTKARVVV